MSQVVAIEDHQVDNARALGIFGLLAGTVASGGLLLFWAMAMRVLFSGPEGGMIVDLGLTGIWNTIVVGYPAIAAAGILTGLALFGLKKYKEAAGAAMLGPIVVVATYFGLLFFFH